MSATRIACLLALTVSLVSAQDPSCCVLPLIHAGCAAHVDDGMFLSDTSGFFSTVLSFNKYGALPGVRFDFDTPLSDEKLWLYSRCPSIYENSYFINGVRYHAAVSSTFAWQDTERRISGTSLVLQAREKNCQVLGLYFGEDDPTSLSWDPATCVGLNTCPCCSYPYYQASCATLTAPVTLVGDAVVGSVTEYTYGQGQGAADFSLGRSVTNERMWADVKAPSGTSNSWFVEALRWHIPTLNAFEWRQINNQAITATDVEFQAREADTELRAIAFGIDNPSANSFSADSCHGLCDPFTLALPVDEPGSFFSQGSVVNLNVGEAVSADTEQAIQAYEGWQVNLGGGTNKINYYFFAQWNLSPTLINLTDKLVGSLESLTFVVSGHMQSPFIRIYTEATGTGDIDWYKSSILAFFNGAPPTHFDNEIHSLYTFDTTTDDYAQPIATTGNGFTLSHAATLADIRAETILAISLQTSSGRQGVIVIHEVRAKFSGESSERILQLYDSATSSGQSALTPLTLRADDTVLEGGVSRTAAAATGADEELPVEVADGWYYTNPTPTPGKKINWYFFKFDYNNFPQLSIAGKRLEDLTSISFVLSGSASDVYAHVYTLPDAGPNQTSWYKSRVYIPFVTGNTISGLDHVTQTIDTSGPVTSYYNPSFTATDQADPNDIAPEAIRMISIQTGRGSAATDLIVHSVQVTFRGEASPRTILLGSA